MASELSSPVSHVFVMGLPRTGTHLMKHVLQGSGGVGLGPEAGFMGGAPRFGVYTRRGLVHCFPRHDAPMRPDAARRLLDRVFSSRRGPWRAVYWQRLAAIQPPDRFIAEFLETPRRASDLFDQAMRVHAGDRMPGDKSPANLWSAERLMQWYPQARVVHMIRDPRATFASMLRSGWLGPTRIGLPDTHLLERGVGSLSAIDLTRSWQRAVRLDARLRVTQPDRYLSYRFEDLVRDPERIARDASRHLGLDFHPAMLEREVVASSYMTAGTPGFRPEAVDAWREHLDPVLARWVTQLAGADLQRLGYSPT